MKKNFIKLFKKLIFTLFLFASLYFILNGFNLHLFAKFTLFKQSLSGLNNKQINNSLIVEMDIKISDEIDNYRNIIQNNDHTEKAIGDLFNLEDSLVKKCSLIPKGLIGQININENIKDMSFTQLEIKYATKFASVNNSSIGGHWKPPNCLSRQRVAIIVPYRDRIKHLRQFLNYMHTFLIRQQSIDYAIYIIEETQSILFNRALLMNIGFKEALKDYDWQCFIFHDVDLVPENDLNLYLCSDYPLHLSVLI